MITWYYAARSHFFPKLIFFVKVEKSRRFLFWCFYINYINYGVHMFLLVQIIKSIISAYARSISTLLLCLKTSSSLSAIACRSYSSVESVDDHVDVFSDESFLKLFPGISGVLDPCSGEVHLSLFFIALAWSKNDSKLTCKSVVASDCVCSWNIVCSFQTLFIYSVYAIIGTYRGCCGHCSVSPLLPL